MSNYIYEKIRGIVVLTIIFVLIASFVQPYTARAILSTAPPRTIIADDVTTTEILDGTILGIDISPSASTTFATINAANIFSSSTLRVIGSLFLPTGSITSDFILDNSVVGADISAGASTTFATINAANITATSSLDVQGTLNVTGETTLNGVAYTWPASDGGASEALITDGAGNLSFSPIADAWELIISTTTENAMNDFVIDVSAASSTYLRVGFIMPVSSGNGAWKMRLNNEKGNSQYSLKRCIDAVCDAGAATQAFIDMIVGNNTKSMFFDFNITNNRSENKTIEWKGATHGSTPAVPVMQEGIGIYFNSTSSISTINFNWNSTAIPAGATFYAWGSAN